MSAPTQLLAALAALREGFVSQAEFLAAAGDWMGAGGDLREILAARADLPPEVRAALDVLAAARIDRAGGDPRAALAEAPGGELVRDALLRLGPPPALVDAVSALRSRASPAEDRYRLGEELGRGGLGRVVAAVDSRLGREVAVKLVLDSVPAALADRFVREARITAQLDHPNVVPVYDFGETRGREVFLCMKRIRGRDLGLLLRDLRNGDAETARVFTRARLLGVFQCVCLAVAYAHSKGVIHRDLKPSNVMIGDFGEVLVVDWGLAKELGAVEGIPVGGGGGAALPSRGAADPAATVVPGSRAPSGETSALTLDGDVLGTPAYMPPEQAEGRVAELDERADIYSLGAILYEILTLRPPVEADSVDALMAQVRSGTIRPPSALPPLRDGRRIAVPPELEAVILKALARRREDRFAGALQLHDEIQLFLEGVRELERRRREALEHTEKGRQALARHLATAGEIAAAEIRVRRLRESIPSHAPLAEKKPLWDAEDALAALQQERLRTYADASAAFGEALHLDPECEGASDGKCALVENRYLESEAVRDRANMALTRGLVEQYDVSGRVRARLDAPGRLSVRAWAYGCGCLSRPAPAGWRGEFEEAGKIAWRDGRPAPAEPVTAADLPVPGWRTGPGPGRAHVRGCPRQEVEGAEVWVARYETQERRLVAGEARRLGVTPLRHAVLPQGSWRCELRPPPWLAGAAPVVFPVRIERGADWEQEATFYAASDLPPHFRQVPGGRFLIGGVWAGGDPAATRTMPDLCVAEFPVTCAEYVEFLNDLVAGGAAEEAAGRVPRDGDRPVWVHEHGRYRLPVGAENQTSLEWAPECPVCAVTWPDAMRFAAWRSAREGRLFRLLHEEEWEKSARGTDGRTYPWGDHYDGTYSHTAASVPGRVGASKVGSFPVDVSPYGIHDMAGGVSTWCLNNASHPYRELTVVRGGAWTHNAAAARSATRRGDLPVTRNWMVGFRLCWSPVAWD